MSRVPDETKVGKSITSLEIVCLNYGKKEHHKLDLMTSVVVDGMMGLESVGSVGERRRYEGCSKVLILLSSCKKRGSRCDSVCDAVGAVRCPSLPSTRIRWEPLYSISASRLLAQRGLKTINQCSAVSLRSNLLSVSARGQI